MAIVYKINGQSMTKAEFDQHKDPKQLKDVFRSRQFPGIWDDTSFVAHRGTLADQLPDADFVCREAIKHGYRPSPNDIYLPSLADYTGDRKAFIKQDGAKGQVKKVCEEKGLQCEGSVKVKAPTRDQDPGFTRPSEEDCKFTSLGQRDPVKVK